MTGQFFSQYTAAWIAKDRFEQIAWRTDMIRSLSVEARIAGQIARSSIEIINQHEAAAETRQNRILAGLGYKRAA